VGFYAVSSSSTTGSDKEMMSASYLQRQNIWIKKSCFGWIDIKDKKTFNEACAHANGAIIELLISGHFPVRRHNIVTQNFLSSVK
jgi:hypothetical protein